MKPLILLTRPSLLCPETESALRAAGYDVVCEPLLNIKPLFHEKPVLYQQPYERTLNPSSLLCHPRQAMRQHRADRGPRGLGTEHRVYSPGSPICATLTSSALLVGDDTGGRQKSEGHFIGRLVLDKKTIIMITSQISLAMLETRRGEVEDILACPCYCVGEKTADAARTFGFREVHAGAGDGAALGQTISQEAGEGALVLHIGAAQTDPASVALMKEIGIQIVPWYLYEAIPAATFSATFHKAFETQDIKAALFFSSRTGQTFGKLMKEAGLADRCRTLLAVALSASVANEIKELPWHRLVIAPAPTQESVLKSLSLFLS